MSLSHEKLDVYRYAINYVSWAFQQCGTLHRAHRHAKDQWLRASQSIPLNIAEGNGKSTSNDRRKYFEVARGSALECAAIQDVLRICGALDATPHEERKRQLDRIAIMLSRLGGRGFSAEEAQGEYGRRQDFDLDLDLDFDFDFDFDSDLGGGSQTRA